LAPWGASAADVLKVVNNTKGPDAVPVTVLIRSLKSNTPSNPWRQLSISPQKTKELQLASPDKYVVVVKAAGMTFESDPVALRDKIQHERDFKLRVVEYMSAPVGRRRPPRTFGLDLGSDPGMELKRTR
jgi:hypothetical protein